MDVLDELRIIKSMIENLNAMKSMNELSLETFIIKWALYSLLIQDILSNLSNSTSEEEKNMLMEEAILALNEAAFKLQTGGFNTPMGQA